MLKKLIKKHIENTIPKNEKVAVMFSGGLDSLSVLLSALELGYEVKLYTFHLKGVISKDLETARKVSKHYKLELHEVEISDNLDLLIDDLKYLIKTHDLKKKTQFQVMHPMKHLCEAIKEDYVLSGLEADTLYGNTRSMRKTIACESEFKNIRSKYIHDENNASYSFIRNELENNNKTFVAPYKQSSEIINYFLSLESKDLCFGKQKKQTYEAFKTEIDNLSLYRRSSNMQINSGIREFHDLLLQTDLNQKNFKSVIGVYNQLIKIVKGEL
jgi:asparagine synthetase B (glutamine-hydrolysing)